MKEINFYTKGLKGWLNNNKVDSYTFKLNDYIISMTIENNNIKIIENTFLKTIETQKGLTIFY